MIKGGGFASPRESDTNSSLATYSNEAEELRLKYQWDKYDPAAFVTYQGDINVRQFSLGYNFIPLISGIMIFLNFII